MKSVFHSVKQERLFLVSFHAKKIHLRKKTSKKTVKKLFTGQYRTRAIMKHVHCGVRCQFWSQQMQRFCLSWTKLLDVSSIDALCKKEKFWILKIENETLKKKHGGKICRFKERWKQLVLWGTLYVFPAHFRRAPFWFLLPSRNAVY